MYHTQSRETNSIDSIVVIPNLRKKIEYGMLFKTNEILNTDHRLHSIHINLEAHFQEEFSVFNKIERRVLNPNKRTYIEKFNEHIEILDSFSLELTVQKLNISTVAKKELEQLDQDISFVLNKVRKKIEGQKRGIPHSK